MLNFAANLNKMINAGLGGPLDPPRTEVAVGHRVVYTEASGAVVNFETNVVAPVKNLRVTMEPIQEGTGDPSPDNIRPITGRESVTVVRTGKNMLDESKYVSLVGCAYNTGVFTANTMSNCNGAFVRLYLNNAVVNTLLKTSTAGERVSFTINADGTWNRMLVGYLMSASNIAARYSAPSVNGVYTLSFTTDVIPTNSVYGKFSEIQLETGSTASDYVPYDGQSVTIQLGQTVYGGTVDVTGGSDGKETWRGVDMGTLNWQYITADTWRCFYASFSDKAKGATNFLCSTYPLSPVYNTTNDKIAYGNVNNSNIYIRDTAYSDVASFKAAMSGQTLCYQIATPTDLPTTPTEMTTLKGTNNVWSDAGDVTLEYPYYEETEGY